MAEEKKIETKAEPKSFKHPFENVPDGNYKYHLGDPKHALACEVKGGKIKFLKHDNATDKTRSHDDYQHSQPLSALPKKGVLESV